MIPIRERDFEDEFIFSASRSSGKGGQHVNKVSTKIELRFHIASSRKLYQEEKHLIYQNLENRISFDGYLIITCSVSRSQLANKKTAIEKFYTIIEKALTVNEIRIDTKPTYSSIKKRQTIKLRNSEKKRQRQKPDVGEGD